YFGRALALSPLLCLVSQMGLLPIVSRSVPSLLVWAALAICLALPFVVAGVAVSLALTRSPFAGGRVYAADLFGAAAGCLGVLVVLGHTDGPSAILWVGGLAAAAALCFSRSAIGGPPPTKLPLDGLLRHRGAIFVRLVSGAIVTGR